MRTNAGVPRSERGRTDATMERIVKNAKKKLGMSTFSACVLGVIAYAGSALAIRPPEQPQCPDVYAPVKCSNGFVYSNGCYASIAGATGCVPYGDEPAES